MRLSPRGASNEKNPREKKMTRPAKARLLGTKGMQIHPQNEYKKKERMK